MAETIHRARALWAGDKRDLEAHTLHVGGQAIPTSSAPEFGGDAAKAEPEGLLVGAASSCHMLWFLHFARKERLRVVSYEDEAEGVMDGTRFVSIVLRPAVRLEEEPSAEVLSSLHERSHEACYIANSLRCPVTVEPR